MHSLLDRQSVLYCITHYATLRNLLSSVCLDEYLRPDVSQLLEGLDHLDAGHLARIAAELLDLAAFHGLHVLLDKVNAVAPAEPTSSLDVRSGVVDEVALCRVRYPCSLQCLRW
jgi:hypothetical protein